jgi:hypothetical protein
MVKVGGGFLATIHHQHPYICRTICLQMQIARFCLKVQVLPIRVRVRRTRTSGSTTRGSGLALRSEFTQLGCLLLCMRHMHAALRHFWPYFGSVNNLPTAAAWGVPIGHPYGPLPFALTLQDETHQCTESANRCRALDDVDTSCPYSCASISWALKPLHGNSVCRLVPCVASVALKRYNVFVRASSLLVPHLWLSQSCSPPVQSHTPTCIARM